MIWKVKYENKGKVDYLWYGGLVSENEKEKRNNKLKENGYIILSCDIVNKI